MCYRLVKRGFDIIFSLIAIIISSPFWIIITIGILLSSSGPVFFFSERIGKDHKPFQLRKFRSMHVASPSKEKKIGYLAEDERIFPFGRFLRKSKLDELPQFLNILRGDMSFVGPRPLPKSSTMRNYVGEYAIALTVDPGLMGLDSLYDYAHGELFINDEMEYRSQVVPVKNTLCKIYVENKSILLDLKIIMRTVYLILAVVFGKNNFSYTQYECQAFEILRSQN